MDTDTSPLKYYDQKRRRVLFINQAATPEFWDTLWLKGDLRKKIESGKSDRFVVPTTRKFVSPGNDKRILDGGCGKGQFVYSLGLSGYNAYGIDYAEKTVSAIRSVAPGLQVSLGDVRQIPFPDGFFDGYWSLGVIEHFYEGYRPIIEEMARVIRPDGYLFLTFPYMSPLRKLKALLGHYRPFEPDQTPLKFFYQFALEHKSVIRDLEALDFVLVEQRPFDGIKGFKDEVSFGKTLLQKVYDGQSLPAKMLTAALSRLFAPFASHSILLVFRKLS